MYRKFDSLGRISLPKEMRDKIGLGEAESEAMIELVDDKIIVTNPEKFDLKKYIANKMLDENISTETYRTLNDILDKIRANQ